MSSNSTQPCGGCNSSVQQLQTEQLAMIGAAFVAGLQYGSGGAAMQSGATANLPPEKPFCIHKIPELPVLLNGKRAAAESVKDFDGKPLYYLLDERARDGETLQVYTDSSKLSQALAASTDSAAKTKKTSPKGLAGAGSPIVLSTGSSPQQIANAIGGAVFMWENINFTGAMWQFGAGTTSGTSGQRGAGHGVIPDFRSVLCFLWFCQNINDRVSSIQNQSQVWANVRPQRSFAVLHQHINFGGSMLFVPELGAFADLRAFGWNDNASSMSYVLTPS